MKRIVLTLTLVLLTLFLFAAEVDTGTITFKGYINPDISFNVTLLSNDSYDLLQELELRPNGVGLNVAEWTLVFGNPPHGGPLYYIQYEYETLKSYTTKDIANGLILATYQRVESFHFTTGDNLPPQGFKS